METEEKEIKKSNPYIIPASIIIAGALIAGAVLYSNMNPSLEMADILGCQTSKAFNISSDSTPFMGPDEGKVTITEFSDYQCPFCRNFWRDTLCQIKEQYIDSGKSVRFVYRDFPLSFHPMAQKYAEAARCSGDQGKYGEMHDKIYQEQDKLGQGTIGAYAVDDVKRWAVDLGLSSFEFNQCLDSAKYADEVRKDLEDGAQAGVQGTPTFFINGIPLVGNQPFGSLKAIIDQELKK